MSAASRLEYLLCYIRGTGCIGVAFSNPIAITGIRCKAIILTDYYNLKQLFLDVDPDAVIHAAAANPNDCQINKTYSCEI